MKNKRYFIPLAVLLIASLACGRVTPATPAASTPVMTAAPTEQINQPAASSNSPRGEPSANAGDMKLDITYCTVEGVELKMDVYYPASNDGPWAVTVYVHGGGWSKGDKADGAGAADIPSLRDAGFLVAAVNYRLAPEHPFPAMIEDVKCAVRSLRAHAAEYNINPDTIGVWGGSAGAHLVALLGTTDESAGFDVGEYLDQSSRVQAVVDMFGPSDLTVQFEGGYESARRVFDGFDAALASPVTYVSADDPPFLILHGEEDELVPLEQSQILLARLQAAGVPAELVVVTNAAHGFRPVGASISPSREEISQLIVEFFEKYLR